MNIVAFLFIMAVILGVGIIIGLCIGKWICEGD